MSVGQGLVPEHAGAQSPQTRQTQKQGPHRIAVLPGDGIGKEVMPEALLVLEAVATKFGINLSLDHFDFASCDYYVKHGRMMPENGRDLIRKHDAILFGSAGHPDIPDHITLWGLRLAICHKASCTDRLSTGKPISRQCGCRR